MHPDDTGPEPIIGAFKIGDQDCYAYFDSVAVAYQWLMQQQVNGTLRGRGVFQSNTVWHDERSFAQEPTA